MTTFLRVLEETENKETALLDTIRGQTGAGRSRYEADPAQFGCIEKSPFAYWISAEIRELFSNLPKLEGEGRTAKQGLATADDFRFVRLWWEVPENQFRKRWFPFAKGGKYSPYYDDIYLVVNWENNGLELSSYKGSVIRNSGYYYRPGLTWPARSQKGFSIKPLPSGSIFSHKGPSFFLAENSHQKLLAFMAILNSKVFSCLAQCQMAFGSYEVGVVQRSPIKDPNPVCEENLAKLARKIWALKFKRNSFVEISHAFEAPPFVLFQGESPEDRYERYRDYLEKTEKDLEHLNLAVDAECENLFGITPEGQTGLGEVLGSDQVGNSNNDLDSTYKSGLDEEGEVALEAALNNLTFFTASFVSWAIGVALGRFFVAFKEEPQLDNTSLSPFEPVVTGSPAMFGRKMASESALTIKGLLVEDDANRELDLVYAVRGVIENIFGKNKDYWVQEISKILNPRLHDLRSWIRSDFFNYHLDKYKAKPRCAPIYWPISTNSRSFTVWLYSSRATPDTLYRVVELVRLRNKDAELELARLDEPSGADERRARNDLEMLVTELKELLVELERIQPLFHPNLDDGTVLVLAPLHRVFKAYPAWQQELADRWKDLVRGEYDWSTQAMRLWPDRVVRKCQTDRSLAIAHGLDEFFWQAGPSEKAVARPVSEDDIQKVIAELTKPAIQHALRSLLDAPPQTRGGTRRPAPARASRGTAARSSTPKTASAEKRRSSSADPQDLSRQVLTFLQGQPELVGKKEILEGTGVSANQWSRVIDALIEQGLVEKVGEKRGAGYRVTDKSDAGGPS